MVGLGQAPRCRPKTKRSEVWRIHLLKGGKTKGGTTSASTRDQSAPVPTELSLLPAIGGEE